MKNILLIVLIASSFTLAQSGFGVELGLAKTGFAAITTHQESDILHPFVNIYNDLQIDNILYITPQIGFATRGGSFTPLPAYVDPVPRIPKITKASFSMNYIDLSLLLKAMLTPADAPLMFTVYGGPTVNYLLGGKVKTSYGNGTPDIEKDIEGISEVGIGATFGAGLGVHAPGGMIEFRTVIFTQFNSSVDANTGLSIRNVSQGLSLTWHLML